MQVIAVREPTCKPTKIDCQKTCTGDIPTEMFIVLDIYIYICMFNIANLDACFSMDCFKMLGFTTNKTIFRATGRKRFFVVSDLTHMTSTIPTGRVIITLQPPPSGTHGFNGEPTHLKALEFYEMR